MSKKLFLIVFISLLIISFSLPFMPVFSFLSPQQNSQASLPPSDRGYNPKTPYHDLMTDTLPRTISFDWNFIIPLLSIPVIYILWRFIMLEQTQYDSYVSYIGAKGGKSKKTRKNQDQKNNFTTAQ